MTDKLKPKKIYVSLDSILDTRLGTLTIINPDFAFDVSTKPEYFTREIDEFETAKAGKLDKEIYNLTIEKFKDKIIRSSIVTRMFVFISKLINHYIQQVIHTPLLAGIELEINTFPYEFSDVEIKELHESIVSVIGDVVKVNFVHLSLDSISLAYAKQNYVAMIMYTYHEWYNKHSEEIKKNPTKELVVYAPRIYFGHLPTEEELALNKDSDKDPFELTQQMISLVLPIEYMPIAFYCANTPYNKDEYSIP